MEIKNMVSKKQTKRKVYKVTTTYAKAKSGKTVSKQKRQLIRNPKKSYPFIQKKGNKVITYDVGKVF